MKEEVYYVDNETYKMRVDDEKNIIIDYEAIFPEDGEKLIHNMEIPLAIFKKIAKVIVNKYDIEVTFKDDKFKYYVGFLYEYNNDYTYQIDKYNRYKKVGEVMLNDRIVYIITNMLSNDLKA
jgi:hypothetical protein